MWSGDVRDTASSTWHRAHGEVSPPSKHPAALLSTMQSAKNDARHHILLPGPPRRHDLQEGRNSHQPLRNPPHRTRNLLSLSLSLSHRGQGLFVSTTPHPFSKWYNNMEFSPPARGVWLLVGAEKGSFSRGLGCLAGFILFFLSFVVE